MTETSSQGAPPAPPLAGIRVLECGEGIASAYAGRLLRDLGADVVIVERGEGSPLRRRSPFVGGNGGPSAAFAYFSSDKRSVVLDSSSQLGELLESADVVLRERNGTGRGPTTGPSQPPRRGTRGSSPSRSPPSGGAVCGPTSRRGTW